MSSSHNGRRGFLNRMLTAGGLAAAVPAAQAQSQSSTASGASILPAYTRAQNYKSLKQSSYDRTGGNRDSWTIPAGGVQEVFNAQGPGVISHIWFTIAAESPDHLKEVVLRAYWDGEPSPSIESPIGDFFGVGHARVSNYWSLPLNMVTGAGPQTQNRAALNCYFPMPFERGARLTVENQGEKRVISLYYQVDYEEHAGGLSDALRLHASWHRQNPTIAQMDFTDRSNGPKAAEVVNLMG